MSAIPDTRSSQRTRALSAEAVGFAKQAFESRNRYLQGQAAAWTILSDQSRWEDCTSDRADAIVQASLEISVEEMWRLWQAEVGKWFVKARRGDFESDSNLTMEVQDQLEEYVRHESYWNTYLKRIISDVAVELTIYHSLMQEAVSKVDDECIQMDLDCDLMRMGLSSYPLPERKLDKDLERSPLSRMARKLIMRLRGRHS